MDWKRYRRICLRSLHCRGVSLSWFAPLYSPPTPSPVDEFHQYHIPSWHHVNHRTFNLVPFYPSFRQRGATPTKGSTICLILGLGVRVPSPTIHSEVIALARLPALTSCFVDPELEGMVKVANNLGSRGDYKSKFDKRELINSIAIALVPFANLAKVILNRVSLRLELSIVHLTQCKSHSSQSSRSLSIRRYQLHIHHQSSSSCWELLSIYFSTKWIYG